MSHPTATGSVLRQVLMGFTVCTKVDLKVSFHCLDADGVNDGGFTSRTRLVMRHLQRAAAAAAGPSSAATPASGSRRRISAAPPPALAAAASGVKDVDQEDGAAAGGSGTTLSFNALTQGHKRLDACRWFYEVLVLGNKGLVKVKQDEPYGDIAITTNLAAMARM